MAGYGDSEDGSDNRNDLQEENIALFTGLEHAFEIVRNVEIPAAAEREERQNHERAGHAEGRFMRMRRAAVFTEEGEEDGAEHVEGSHAGGDHADVEHPGGML